MIPSIYNASICLYLVLIHNMLSINKYKAPKSLPSAMWTAKILLSSDWIMPIFLGGKGSSVFFYYAEVLRNPIWDYGDSKF